MNDNCSICLDTYKNPRRTQCGHVFCRDCIIEWKNEANYFGEKKETCPLCRNKIGLLRRVNMMVNRKVTKKKEPVKRVYRTRYKIAEEKISEILGEYASEGYHFGNTEELWNMAERVSREGNVYLTHNKSMREVFNRKMKEFAIHDRKFLTLIKK